MKPYLKRAKSGYRGKGCKNQCAREERQHAKREIKQALAEAEADFLHRYKGKGKPNMRKRLEYRIKWYEEILAPRGRTPLFSSSYQSWSDRYFNKALADARRKLKELLDEEDAAKA